VTLVQEAMPRRAIMADEKREDCVMGLMIDQLSELDEAPAREGLRTVWRDGREFAVPSGWWSINEANRIFGPDSWDREILEMRCLERRAAGGGHFAVYVARVRITVRGGGTVVVREGHATATATAGNVGEAHDLAIRNAEIVATRRALATFGRRFGLGILLGERPDPAPPFSPDASAPRPPSLMRPSIPRPAVPPSPKAAAGPGGGERNERCASAPGGTGPRPIPLPVPLRGAPAPSSPAGRP
jgi:hypothetical protein